MLEPLDAHRRTRIEGQIDVTPGDVRHGCRHQNLTGGGMGAEASGHVDRGPVVAIVDRDRLPEVETGTYSEGEVGLGRRCFGAGELDIKRRPHGLAGSGEGG